MDKIQEIVPAHILSINPYVPGKPIEELERELGITGCVKLASNENPLGPSHLALEAIEKTAASIHRYPDGNAFFLKQALAERLYLDPPCLVMGNGSNEVIEIIARTFLATGESAIMADPSFSVYLNVVQAMGGNMRMIPLKDGRHDLRRMAEAITDGTKLVFIANPNNPTGTMNAAEEMADFMEMVPEDVVVVVDEAYYEYVTREDYPDSLVYVREGRNVVVLRTFSKIYGLAGLRIGYGIARPELVDAMNRVRQPFNTNAVAQAAALAALSDDDHVRRSIHTNDEGKVFLYRLFDEMGISYLQTETNFVWMELGRDARQVYEALLRKGVITRPMGPTNLRVSIGLPEENQRFAEAFREVMQ